jgi:hypothetical protein
VKQRCHVGHAEDPFTAGQLLSQSHGDVCLALSFVPLVNFSVWCSLCFVASPFLILDCLRLRGYKLDIFIPDLSLSLSRLFLFYILTVELQRARTSNDVRFRRA